MVSIFYINRKCSHFTCCCASS